MFQQDLDARQRDLAQLSPGTDASIGGGCGLILIFHMHEDRSLSVTVDDHDRLTAALSLRPRETWIPEHQQRLEHIRGVWPAEVVKTAPMTCEWRLGRKP
ncbi:DUF5959 family protein [Streptomyces sp. NPDC049970]|uniref:DUF5959 family protein n=1 Tax=Streptomyces sp. NPDC049970 TaxID=3155033 RepID=UPI003433EBB2